MSAGAWSGTGREASGPERKQNQAKQIQANKELSPDDREASVASQSIVQITDLLGRMRTGLAKPR